MKHLLVPLTIFFSGDCDNSHRVRDKSGESLDILQVIDKFKTHPIKIKENVNNEIKFSFALSSLDEIKKCINKLNTAKPTTYNNILAKILVEYSDVCSELIHMLYIDSIQNGTFPNAMKLADI